MKKTMRAQYENYPKYIVSKFATITLTRNIREKIAERKQGVAKERQHPVCVTNPRWTVRQIPCRCAAPHSTAASTASARCARL